MRYYNNVITSQNNVLSCDMVRYSFIVDKNNFNLLNCELNTLSLQTGYSFNMVQSVKQFGYRYLITFKYDDNSVVLGLCFNGVKRLDDFNCFIEFNPNKTLSNGYTLPILNILKKYCKHFQLVRFDLAVDLPVKRDFVQLVKDRRLYNKIYGFDNNSCRVDDITEYLGRRNKNGFVKLYNKTLESKLVENITRLEITLDSFDYDNLLKHLPVVYYSNSVNMLDYLNFNKTDRVLLSLLLQVDNSARYVKLLSHCKRAKFQNILFSMKNKILITEYEFYNIVKIIKNIL